jgi:hypothetical protein
VYGKGEDIRLSKWEDDEKDVENAKEERRVITKRCARYGGVEVKSKVTARCKMSEIFGMRQNGAAKLGGWWV